MPAVSVRHWAFGSIELDDGDVVIHDGGTHGVQGHSIERRGGSFCWQRRLDGFRPHGRAGAGPFLPTDGELAELGGWLDVLWAESAPGKQRRPPPPAPPRWIWIVAQRRGDETRSIDGDSYFTADAATPLLDWLKTRVDGLCPG